LVDKPSNDSSKNSKKEANNDIKDHELVDKIVRDINNPGNVTVLCGYIGKSGSEDIVRLYTNLEFGEYFEIKREDILASKEVSDDVIPFGGTCIFVDDNTEIRRVRIETTKQQAMFIGGKVSETFVKPRPQGMPTAMAMRRRRRGLGKFRRAGRRPIMSRFAGRRRAIDTLSPQTPCFACGTFEVTPCERCGTQTNEQTPCWECPGGTNEQTPCWECPGGTNEQTPCWECPGGTREQTPCWECPTREQTPCWECPPETVEVQTPCFACEG
jgi:hypothetical protein